MNLSARAQTYLGRLHRSEPLSSDAVAEALRAAGVPRFASWLDFHDRFGGFHEVIGKDTAIWGIVHAHPTWLSPGEPEAERDESGWRVMCADIHPSYDYWLTERGEFVGTVENDICENFDVKVERNALLWSVSEAMGRKWSIDSRNELLKAAGGLDSLLQRSGAAIETPASDRYQSWWVAGDMIVCVGSPSPTVYFADDSRGALVSLVRS